MADTQLLTDVKKALGITGDYLDGTLGVHIDTVVNFLVEGGVKESNINAGIVSQGVTDLWDYYGGAGQFSSAFKMMATQLSYKK